MDELVEWLRVQLDVDERDARERRGIFPSAAVDEHANVWLHVTERGTAVVTKYLHATEGYRDVADLRRWCEPSNGEGWNTERVLREVEAKRRILDAYEKALDRRRLFCDDVASAGALLQMVAVVKLLALPYSDRPGRPSTEE